MVKDHSKKPAAATWATPSDQQQEFFYMHHPTERVAYTTVFVTPVVEHWLERESFRRPIAPWVNALTTELHLAPCYNRGFHFFYWGGNGMFVPPTFNPTFLFSTWIICLYNTDK